MTAKWTPEPWAAWNSTEGNDPDSHDDESSVSLLLPCYERARLCVNALANRDPALLADLETAVEAMLACPLGGSVVRARLLRRAFDDFRGVIR